MCGILGTIDVPFDITVLDQIIHRGPDDSGIEEIAVIDHTVRFGQRRLSIIDVSPAGHQPMYSSCKNYLIIFNGEIYNHKELREFLPGQIKFKGHSDSESILYYLIKNGINGIRDFNGIFAFAFLDCVHNKLYLARDPIGVKPLYYYNDGNKKFIFSSEIRPIKSLIGKSDLYKKALASLLRLRYNPAPDTLYQQIHKVRPGHMIEIDLNNTRLKPKHISFINEIPLTINNPPADLIKQYGQKFEEAVKRQLLSDVEVGILLSGGIDSALVSALAQKHYPGKMKAFTVGFEGNYSEDEIEDAAETADILGLDHHSKKISFTDFLQIIKECTQIVEEPLATTSIIPMYFLSELAANKVKVVLSGQGADEPLGGYTRYKTELIRKRIPEFLYGLFIPLAQILKIRNEKISNGINALGIKHEINRFIAIYEVFHQEEIEKLISITDQKSAHRISYFYELLNCENKTHPVERMMALDTRMNLSDDLLNYTDKITMHFSLECRVPMLDLELVKYIESLPVHLKLNLNERKIIHKKFAREILPYRIIHRKKKGFLSPTNNWFRNEADLLKEILLSSGTNFSKVFNQTYVAEIIKQHQRGYNKEKRIFLLLSIYFWLESFSDGQSNHLSISYR